MRTAQIGHMKDYIREPSVNNLSGGRLVDEPRYFYKSFELGFIFSFSINWGEV